MSKTDTYINKHTKAHIDAQAYTKEEKKQERKKNIGERH